MRKRNGVFMVCDWTSGFLHFQSRMVRELVLVRKGQGCLLLLHDGNGNILENYAHSFYKNRCIQYIKIEYIRSD